MTELDKAKKDLYDLLNGLIPQESTIAGKQIAIPMAIGSIISAARMEIKKEREALWLVVHQVRQVLYLEDGLKNAKEKLDEYIEHLNKIEKNDN